VGLDRVVLEKGGGGGGRGIENDNETHRLFFKIISDSLALTLISTNINSFLEEAYEYKNSMLLTDINYSSFLSLHRTFCSLFN